MKELNVVPFSYEGKSVRTIQINGEPWFVAKDVAEMLGYINTRDAISKHCKGGSKMRLPSETGGIQEYTVIPESDVWRLIIKSTLPEAQKIEKWIMETVLPSIRKTGSFISANQENGEDPKYLVARALLAAGKLLEEKDAIIAELTPKAEFSDHVKKSETLYSFSEACKILAFDNLGSTSLFRFCREKGYLMNNNEPYQEYLQQGLFKQIVEDYNKPSGNPATYKKTVFTGKGLKFISERLVESGKKYLHQPGLYLKY